MADPASTTENKKMADDAVNMGATTPVVDEADTKLGKADAANVDEAYAAFQNHGDVVVDAATDKRLLRTIDRHILPIMCVIYGM